MHATFPSAPSTCALRSRWITVVMAPDHQSFEGMNSSGSYPLVRSIPSFDSSSVRATADPPMATPARFSQNASTKRDIPVHVRIVCIPRVWAVFKFLDHNKLCIARGRACVRAPTCQGRQETQHPAARSHSARKPTCRSWARVCCDDAVSSDGTQVREQRACLPRTQLA